VTIPQAPAGGKLVKVQIRKGLYMKMYESQARAKGLLPPEEKTAPQPKKRLPGSNKKLTPDSNKALASDEAENKAG
jgi:hypothetical protein